MKWVLKTSSLRVATLDDDRVYRSIQDAPAELRDRIREAIEGPDARTILIANQEVYDQILKQGETSNLEQEHGPGAPPVASVARAESLNARDRRLPVDARRVLIVMFAAIAALWTIWAVLIQIGR